LQELACRQVWDRGLGAAEHAGVYPSASSDIDRIGSELAQQPGNLDETPSRCYPPIIVCAKLRRRAKAWFKMVASEAKLLIDPNHTGAG
jgi:hypothetical protein